jgi:hypothetical protein
MVYQLGVGPKGLALKGFHVIKKIKNKYSKLSLACSARYQRFAFVENGMNL